MKKILQSYTLGDMKVTYIEDNSEETGNRRCGMLLYPAVLGEKVSIDGSWHTDSLVQVKIVGDSYPVGFSHGYTMRNSQTVEKLSFVKQTSSTGNPMTIETVLESEDLIAVHRLVYSQGMPYISIQTEITNRSQRPVSLEMLSSYSICGLSPFGSEELMEDMNFYRLRSKWSAEGRLIKESFLSLQMEPSWQKYGVQSVRFGAVGSMPVRGFFPWAAVEDTRYGVMTGAQLYHNGSWQMELYGRDERAALSGGLADREFGHWMKILQPNETFCAPKAVLSTCIGNVDELSWRLTFAQKEGRLDVPAVEKDLPVVFNEFCTTWGNPTEENLHRIVQALNGKGITYLVIDAGWYSITDEDWNGDMGDWDINQNRFPGGFENVVYAIRDAGMIPGLWFEMECVGQNTKGFCKEDWQLMRDHLPIQVGMRRFWDLRKCQVTEYLEEKVIDLLRRYKFGYLKVDYNDTIGIGCDGAESLGEGLRQCAEASSCFFKKIHQELPELVIENCSSGGHRLEPSMQALASMSSFSDAHECIHIPIIAANVQRAVLPEQSQIWAVLRAGDDDKRLYYSMINTFLGRMCLSGDIIELNQKQWQIVDEGISFYKKAAPVIRDGKSRRFGNEDVDYNKPKGWQAVVREGILAADGWILTVVHRFWKEAGSEIRNSKPETVLLQESSGMSKSALQPETRSWKIELALPRGSGSWKIADCYCRSQVQIVLKEKEGKDFLMISGMEELEAAAVLLKL